MSQFRTGVQDVMDRKKWEARGAVLMTKLKATKEVWFPSGPAGAAKSAGATAKKATSRTTKKTTGAAKRTSNNAKKAASTRKKS